jgi:flavin reductase (DIM6/NTAB) family NADH-FMN oxidoreductase RutF
MESLNQTLNTGDQLRLGMRHWASGVGVAATEFEGTRAGLTVSSFTSVSVDPPMVLISVNKSSYAHDLILKSGKFGVTLLAEDQQTISDRFAGRVDQEIERFEGLETFTLKTGSPLLAGGLAAFDCEIRGRFDTGSTTVIFGKVVAAEVLALHEDGKAPLLYYDQEYRELAE